MSVLGLLSLLMTLGLADENSYLDFIPKQVGEAKSAEPVALSSLSRKIYIEEAFSYSWNRSSLLVPLSVVQPVWQSRTSLDGSFNWQAHDRLNLHFSDRLSLFAQDDLTWFGRGTVRNDLKEVYASFEIFPRTYLEAGRINVRNGVALGFNPVDFFRTRSLVNQVSIDPSSVRENRLGTLALQAQRLWDGGSLTVGVSPAVQNTTQLTQARSDALDLRLGQTNSVNRWYATVGVEVFGLSPQALILYDDIGTHLGATMSKPIGDSIIAYAEWSGVMSSNLSTRAITFGQATGSLPQGMTVIPQAAGNGFQNDVALGASWTSPRKLTLNLEYHFHQSGFTSSEFSNWVNLGQASPLSANALWFVRQYAQDQREPLMQSEVFFRFDYPDLLMERWSVSGLAFVNPYEGSTLAQLSTQYFYSDAWTFGLFYTGTFGTTNTEYGSIPYASSVFAQALLFL